MPAQQKAGTINLLEGCEAMNRVAMLLVANEEFAEAYRRGEPWALKRIEAVAAIDNPTRNFPERDEFQDGLKRNWCGSCPFRDGCVACDLPYDPGMKAFTGTIASYKVECKTCGFVYGIVEATTQQRATWDWTANLRHRQQSPSCQATCLSATEVRDPMSAA